MYFCNKAVFVKCEEKHQIHLICPSAVLWASGDGDADDWQLELKLSCSSSGQILKSENVLCYVAEIVPSMVTFDKIKQNALFFLPPPPVSNNDVYFNSLPACEGDCRSVGLSYIWRLKIRGRKLPQITGFWHCVHQKPCLLLNCPLESSSE